MSDKDYCPTCERVTNFNRRGGNVLRCSECKTYTQDANPTGTRYTVTREIVAGPLADDLIELIPS